MGRAFKFSDYEKIQKGMTEAQVRALMGEPYHVGKNSNGTIGWVWYRQTPLGKRMASIMFKDGIVLEDAPKGAPLDMNSPEYRKERLKAYVQNHPDLKKEIKHAILSDAILVGMAPAEVEFLRGQPLRKNISGGAHGTHEQWVYSGDSYLYFENAQLTSWQYSR